MRRVLVLISARTLRLSTLLNLPREAKAFNTSNVIIYLFFFCFPSFLSFFFNRNLQSIFAREFLNEIITTIPPLDLHSYIISSSQQHPLSY